MGLTSMDTLRFPTAKDAAGLKSVSSARISPDGVQIAFVLGYPDQVDKNAPQSLIWKTNKTIKVGSISEQSLSRDPHE